MRIQSCLTSAVISFLILSVAPGCADAQQGANRKDRAQRADRLMAVPNPMEPSASVWIEDLTYMEVRDRIAAGATTVIISTGGVEENGPFIVTGKHNVILESLCPAIVQDLGNALCAPIVPFVPEGNFDPPSGAMLFPGSITVRDATYQSLLEDIGNSLKLHGFTDIILIGDSGGNQKGMQAAADALNASWADREVRAHFVVEFYTDGWAETEEYTAKVLGVSETKNDGHHDDIWVTAIMMVTDPETVRYRQRVAADLASINGVDISDLEATIELGQKMVDFRAALTADVIRAAIEGE